MKCNNLSASRIKCFSMCPFKHYVEYHLGIRGRKNFAAEQGSMCHEIYETFGRAKMANEVPDIANSWIDVILEAYRSEDAFWKLSQKAISREKTCDTCEHRSACGKQCTITNFGTTNFDGCPKIEFNEAVSLIEKVIYNKSKSNPLNKKIVGVENKFVLNIEDKNETIPVVGFIDISTEFDHETLEISDYKTGNYVQTFEQCQKDPQLLIYHLAGRMHYPQYKNIIVTIWYLKKGPISLSFSAKDERATVRAIKHYWHLIRNNIRPTRRCDRPFGGVNFDYKCKYMCDSTLCQAKWEEFQEQGGIIVDNVQTPYDPNKKRE